MPNSRWLGRLAIVAAASAIMPMLAGSAVQNAASHEQGSEPYARLIGLLTLPQVFGQGPCTPFNPTRIPLYDGPEGSMEVGEIRVHKYWTFQTTHACEGLEVRASVGKGPLETLPALEYAYEAPAAIVVARHDDWFKVKTAGGAAWMHAEAQNRYYPLEELLPEQMTYLTADWDGSFYATPGGARLRAPTMHSNASARVLEVTRLAGELWIRVETGRSECDPDAPPQPTVKGWVRGYGHGHAPALWFHSRGC